MVCILVLFRMFFFFSSVSRVRLSLCRYLILLCRLGLGLVMFGSILIFLCSNGFVVGIFFGVFFKGGKGGGMF